MKKLLWMIFASILAMTASAKEVKSFKIGMSQEFDNLNPIMTSMHASAYILAMTNRSILVIGHGGRVEPHLIEKIPTFENGLAEFVEEKGKKKIRAKWKFREKARWADGMPVTCEDFLFTIRVAKSNKSPVPNLMDFEKIEKAEVTSKDKKECTFTYKAANWHYNRPGFYVLPKHIEEKVFEKYLEQPNGYTNNSTYSTAPTTPGLYSGPYRITELKLGSHIVLEPNPYFYGRQPSIKKIVLKLIPNTATLEANLLSKTIDMISVMGLSFDQALKFNKKIQKEGLPYKINFQTTMLYEHIDLNLEDFILRDINVRKALSHSVNRKDLTQVLFEGKQVPADHFLPPEDPWFSVEGITKYPYSLRKSKKLLEKSGWKVGKEGFRYKDGKKLELTINSTAGRKVRELVQVYLKDQWRKIGLDLVIKNYPARVFFGEYTKKAKFEHMAMYANVGEPERSPRRSLHSRHVPTPENNFSGTNRTKWSNAEVDRLLDLIDQEFDPSKRKEYMRKVLGHYTEELPRLPLFHRAEISVIPKNLSGYEMTGNVYTPTNYVENWQLN